MPHINQLIDKFGPKGLAVVGITDEPKADTQKFIRDTGAKMIVVYDTKAGARFGISGFPSAFLVDSSGTVVWKGHPGGLTDEVLESFLSKLKPALSLPAKFAPIVALYDKEKVGEAYVKIETELAKTTLEASDRAALEAAKKTIADRVEKELSEAKSLAEKNLDYAQALKSYEKISRVYLGMASAQLAKEEFERIKSNPLLKGELEAGNKVLDAQQKMDGKLYQQAWKILASIPKAYPGTGAATKAESLMAQIKDRGFYGYNPNCKDCKKLGKACSDCRTSAKW